MAVMMPIKAIIGTEIAPVVFKKILEFRLPRGKLRDVSRITPPYSECHIVGDENGWKATVVYEVLWTNLDRKPPHVGTPKALRPPKNIDMTQQRNETAEQLYKGIPLYKQGWRAKLMQILNGIEADSVVQNGDKIVVIPPSPSGEGLIKVEPGIRIEDI